MLYSAGYGGYDGPSSFLLRIQDLLSLSKLTIHNVLRYCSSVIECV